VITTSEEIVRSLFEYWFRVDQSNRTWTAQGVRTVSATAPTLNLPWPMQNGKPLRYDFEYRREDTCNLFMFLQPLAGWRHVKVTDRRTKQDSAWCMNDNVVANRRAKGGEAD
jgi:hypothetical protein